MAAADSDTPNGTSPLSAGRLATMNSAAGSVTIDSTANERYVADHPIDWMSTPPTELHTTPPTPVNAITTPRSTPARLVNQRLIRVDGARNSSIPTPMPIAAAPA